MKLEYAISIVESNPEALYLHKEYSGRGMYGRTTAAVSGDEVEYEEAVMEVLDEYLDENDPEKTKEFVAAAFCGRRDSLGLGTIWY